MKFGNYKVVKRGDNKRYIVLANVDTGEEVTIDNSTAEHYLMTGKLHPAVIFPSVLDENESYVIEFESVLGGCTYYLGFRPTFDKCIGITADINEAKVFKSANKAVNKIAKLVKKSDMLFIKCRKLNEVI